MRGSTSVLFNIALLVTDPRKENNRSACPMMLRSSRISTKSESLSKASYPQVLEGLLKLSYSFKERIEAAMGRIVDLSGHIH